MLIGYARVSTDEQSPALQEDALKKAGCERIFTDYVSGASLERPAWNKALETLREGDILVVWRLDRLGRNLKDLIGIVEKLKFLRVGFRSLQEGIDTTTPGGMLVFHIFGALAEFERNLMRERTNAGLEAARLRGRTGGRPKAMTTRQVEAARRMYEEGEKTVDEICKELNVSKATLYRYVAPTLKKSAMRRGDMTTRAKENGGTPEAEK